MTKRNFCRAAWMIVLAVLAGVWPGIAEDDDQTGRRQSTPNLSGVSPDERRMIESACRAEKMFQGPAAYNRCLASQLSALKDTPRIPDLSRLTSAADAAERTPNHSREVQSARQRSKIKPFTKALSDDLQPSQSSPGSEASQLPAPVSDAEAEVIAELLVALPFLLFGLGLLLLPIMVCWLLWAAIRRLNRRDPLR